MDSLDLHTTLSRLARAAGRLPPYPHSRCLAVRLYCDRAVLLLSDVEAAGLTPVVCGVPWPQGGISLVFWCTNPRDVAPLLQLALRYDKALLCPASELLERTMTPQLTGAALWEHLASAPPPPWKTLAREVSV